MSSGSIVVLIIAGIVMMVGVAFLAQTLENNRRERLRRIKALEAHAQRLWNHLSAIPPQYLTASLRQFLLAEIRRCYREVLQLAPSHAQAQSQLKALEKTAAQTSEEPPLDSLKPPFEDQLTGRNIRSEIKNLVNHLVQLHQEGLVDASLAQQYTNQGKALYALSGIDISLITARQMERSDNPRAALAHYQSCLKQLQKIHPILNLPKRIENLEQRVESLTEKAKTQASREQDDEAAQQDEWDKLVKADQQDWKIKQDYED